MYIEYIRNNENAHTRQSHVIVLRPLHNLMQSQSCNLNWCYKYILRNPPRVCLHLGEGR